MSLQTVKAQAKYGLINKKVNLPNTGSQGLKPKLVTRKASVFLSEDYLLEADDGDGDEGDNKNKRNTQSSSRECSRNEISKVNNLLSSEASKEVDLAVYDYDGEYDSFKSQREEVVSRLSSSQPSAVSIAIFTLYT